MNSLPFTRGIRAIVREPRWARLGHLWVDLRVDGSTLSSTWWTRPPENDIAVTDIPLAMDGFSPRRMNCLVVEYIGEAEEARAAEFGVFPSDQIIRPSCILAGLVSEVELTPTTSYLELLDSDGRFIGFYRNGDFLEPCVWGHQHQRTTVAYIPADQCLPPVTNWQGNRSVKHEPRDAPNFRHFLKGMRGVL